MPTADAALLAALQAAPRRYRMPPLPADAQAARAQGTDVALAWAIEAARIGKERGSTAPAAARELFLSALSAFIREALAPSGGDPSYQALVLQARHEPVREFVRLLAHEAADRRAVRSAVDALAHPGKLRAQPQDARRAALERLHALAAVYDWARLRDEVESLPDPALRSALASTAMSTALERLQRIEALRASAAVREYLALGARRGPLAGSHAAAAQGRASARLGDDAEQATIAAFHRIAALLQPHDAPHAWRVLRGLHTPRGFPADAGKAKNEWDAAIVREGERGADIVLLAEVKASPAAATSDLAKLHRGLARLAQAEPGRTYAFAADGAEVHVAGSSLVDLRPQPHALPARVIYCCTAQPQSQSQSQVQMLGAASKAVLAADPASVAHALRVVRGEPAQPRELTPVWDALTSAPRLRATLHQYETAQEVRAAMLHPDDLVASVEIVTARL